MPGIRTSAITYRRGISNSTPNFFLYAQANYVIPQPTSKFNKPPPPPPPPTPTILVYNTSQGPTFVWSGVTFTLNTNLPNYSYTAITTSIYYNNDLPSPSNLTSVTLGNSLTNIGTATFVNCTSLTSVTIPSSVITIGDRPFDNCSSLTSIIVDTSNSNYSSLNGVLFNKLQTTLIQYPGGKSGSYTIPSSVTSIGIAAFQNCLLLTNSITIPNSVTSIGSSVFANCSGLTSVTLPTNPLFTTIGISTFQGCSGLTSITIPSSVTSIGIFAFSNCTSLPSITIPNSVISIGNNAFSASGVTTVYISNATASLLGSQLSYTWTSTASPGTLIPTPQFYNAPNNVRFILPP